MKLFRIRDDDFIRCNVEHRAVVAVDVMEYLGNSFSSLSKTQVFSFRFFSRRG